MKITFKAQVVVDSPEHTDVWEEIIDKKYPWRLTINETKKLLEQGLFDVEIVPNYGTDIFPTIIMKLKKGKNSAQSTD